ncbi:aspartoacylase [Gilvimarinus agarilyticus]|uniref:aspartoacylase n=1 Tax=Gilvimarinus sp. 2_MG-2023 TaxID=3062666 RepID=UPI001C096888|nr:aspartoacylase [Gilvimarinus sp. 2_MG-2023]MBU2884365.1 aspartoacylase [Gilvimarinus agarilyticus]MDO6569501.1 aspartoacylase [Gilvimarinus sp. 2_MG-2023]
MNKTINTVAITGGTHGNELTGVYLIKHWQSQPQEVARSSFTPELHIANPAATQEVRRYVDQDLNRQFNIADLADPQLAGCEQQRAKALNTLLGPKEGPRVDFVIDMHTTTANMGMSLVFNSNHPLVIGMAFYIKQKMPNANLFYSPTDRLEDNFLRSMGRFGGLVIEVGPISQGLLNYQVYADTRTAVMHALDYLELYNVEAPPEVPKAMTGYRFIEKIPFPTNDQGEITGMIHPVLQGQDYQPIDPGDPLFITLTGETIVYQGVDTVYGAFINEAAYYDRNIGLSLMEKVDISYPTDSLDSTS